MSSREPSMLLESPDTEVLKLSSSYKSTGHRTLSPAHRALKPRPRTLGFVVFQANRPQSQLLLVFLNATSRDRTNQGM